MKHVILSGIKPTGKLHLGNLFGAVLNWVKLQETCDCHYMIADLHALTGPPSGYAELDGFRKNVIVNLLAFGIDPERSVLFNQSEVTEHSQLHLVLSMLTPIPWLERNPTYKDQVLALNNKDLNNYGFLGYPVLQAADIVLYKADRVPVGEDQLPHLELTREIVRRFNSAFKPLFPEPEALLTASPKIPGLDGRKMSKSFDNAIYLDDDAGTVEKKCMRLITDPQKIRRNDKGHPDVCNCFHLHAAFASTAELAEVRSGCEAGTLGCVECKKNLACRINTFLEPYREKRAQWLSVPDRVNEVMALGRDRAAAKARATLGEVFETIGLGFRGI